jgi:putative selenate reductase molybdopterin-binding subunit
MKKKSDFQVVGQPVPKVDGFPLAQGAPLFCEDRLPRNCLVARMLRSPHAHARIVSIDATGAEELEGVHAVIHHQNVPRVMRTTAGQGAPEPSPYDFTTFDSKVRFVGDRVAAVAAESPSVAEEALRRIKVEYELLEPVFDPRKSMDSSAPVIHDEPDAKVIIPVPFEPERNLAAHVDMMVGDVEAGLEQADTILDREYVCQYAQHTPIEPHCALAEPLADGRIRITTSTQVPFHARRIVAQALELPVSRIHVVKPRIGGGFGAKQEVLIEDVAAFLAQRAGLPVFFRLNRSEEFTSRTRHSMVVRLRTGVMKDGSLTAVDLDVLSNTGAYGSHGLTVACNCGSKVLPLYRWPKIRFSADAVYTNLPVGGAYRGYGATQAAFAMEIQMDEMAHAIGMDPVDFRRMNHIRKGETSPVFEALGEGGEGTPQSIGSIGLDRCIRAGAKAIGGRRKRKPGKGPVKTGLGMACLMQGSSIPQVDMGAASIKMNEDGSFNLLVGATDLGTGSDTVLAQIAAETLGVDLSHILVTSSDTDLTPFDVGAYASSTTYLSGEAVNKAARDVADQIRKVAAQMLEVAAKKIHLEGGKAVAENGKSVTLAEVALRTLYERDQHQIAAFASHITHKSPPPFSAHFAKVEVDTETGLVKVIKYVAAVDCGTAINPALAEGQTEGAVVNGLSYALCEEFLFNEKGKMRNDSFREYKIFCTRDLPEIETILIPTYEKTGPYGAKSVSEIGINGPLPVLSNAIFDAVGVRLREAPYTPERVLAALADSGETGT